MENLNKELKELKLVSKTGLLHHKDMLKHAYSEDPEQGKNHPENPYRLMSIMERLEKNKLTELCDVVDNMEEIDWDLVKATHGERYCDYLEGLWPEGMKKYKINFGDTYYNKDSVRAARLAAEATRIATDRVYQGIWENAFAAVRPPGHHAAAKNNRVGGFCFINNVMVSANYLENQYNVKKILILDWDVHHGDSSQLFSYKNPNILYISIHKYLHGVFYPGKSGDVKYTGEGEGEGFNLNFPINPIEGQYVGDAEYIYIFERMIYPIIKEFDPSFVFVSCGFDCLLGDPKGLLHVTQDSLSYMLFKIKNYVQKKVCVVLEGGYNLEKIAEASECILRLLLSETHPNSANKIDTTMEKLLKFAIPTRVFYNNAQENLNVWKNHWKVLSSDELVKYDELIKRHLKCEGILIEDFNEQYEIKEGRVRRKFSAKTIEFLLSDKAIKEVISKYLVKSFNLSDIGEDRVVEYGDIASTDNFNILCLKIAKDYKPDLYHKEVIDKYRFLIQKYVIKNKEGDVIEKRVEIFNALCEEEMQELMNRFFKFKNQESINLIFSKLSLFLKDLWAVLGQKVNLFETHLLIYFNPENEHIRFILEKFEWTDLTIDQNLTGGLEGIELFFKAYHKQASHSGLPVTDKQSFNYEGSDI